MGPILTNVERCDKYELIMARMYRLKMLQNRTGGRLSTQ